MYSYAAIHLKLKPIDHREYAMTDKTPEERIAALEAELASLRKPVPREAPLHRTIEGQGPTQFDRAGNRVLPDPLPASTTVGGDGAGVRGQQHTSTGPTIPSRVMGLNMGRDG